MRSNKKTNTYTCKQTKNNSNSVFTLFKFIVVK